MSISSKIKKEKVNYNVDIQRLLIIMLISEPSLFIRCQSIIKPEYFDNSLQKTVKFH